jgi:FkbM family methyltransferase
VTFSEFLLNTANRLLSRTSYEIKRKKSEPVENAMAPSTLDAVSIMLGYLVKSQIPDLCLVQVGACDGKTGDPIYGILRKGLIRAVLVEPVPESFAELKENYAGIPNIHFCNAAVSSAPGTVSMYTTRQARDEEGRHWTQVSSFDENHLLKHGADRGQIITIPVRAVTLQELVDEYKLDRIDFLQIDAEGFDAEIVQLAFKLPQLPRCINYEHLHLSSGQQAEVLEAAAKLDYDWLHDRWNTLLVQRAFLESIQ